jgi:DNA-binding HxlR family transcriptional regulator
MPYADYCPIASGVEILGDRWTPLVIRELTVGASGFNEIHRGIPKMSRTLLAQRLRQLERQGLVTRETSGRGRAGGYHLTPSGQALSQVVWSMGQWAAEWVFAEPDDEELDGLSLLWRLHQFAIPSELPRERTTVHLVLSGPNGAEGWLAIDGREVSVCKDDPGLDVDLAVEAPLGHMHEWIVGRVTFNQLVREGQVRTLGPSRLARAFPRWFHTDTFAASARRGERRKAKLTASSA